MMRILKLVLLGLIALSAMAGGYVFLQLRALDVEKLSEDLWVLRGMGGNTAVLRTDVGAVVVDSLTFPMQGKRIRELARELTGAETVLLINTHYHLDHTHGNPAFEPGTRVLSTERTLSHLLVLDADFWSGDAAALLPNETFSDRQTLKIGGKSLELVHPGRGHTDGDLVVVFHDERVVHMGDLFFNRFYPNIDLEAGGSVQEWPATIDAASSLPFDLVIPGHGMTTDRAGLADFRRFLTQLGDIGRQAAHNNTSLEATLATDRLTADAGYGQITMIVPVGLSREFVLRRAWEESTGNFEREN